jgi:hypothetical protein
VLKVFFQIKEYELITQSTYDPGITTGRQSQLITDDLVESLTEISSFFMPDGIVASPVDYVNDSRKSLPLDSNVVLVEIATQQIVECKNQLSIQLKGKIIEGFLKPREFSYFLSHSYPRAKIFPGHDHLQTFELSEFLRLEYPEIPLVLSDTIFSLNFLNLDVADEPSLQFNGGGCLILGDESS